MGWATPYIEKLRHGETVQFRPQGNSMAGKIESAQLCTVVPTTPAELSVGDIVLCKVNGFQYARSSVKSGFQRPLRKSRTILPIAFQNFLTILPASFYWSFYWRSPFVSIIIGYMSWSFIP
jgi:hypothetical protein